jgi:hypothetical protein
LVDVELISETFATDIGVSSTLMLTDWDHARCSLRYSFFVPSHYNGRRCRTR